MRRSQLEDMLETLKEVLREKNGKQAVVNDCFTIDVLHFIFFRVAISRGALCYSAPV